MTPREPAGRRLERVLAVLPLASREGGVALEELAEKLGVDEERILRDLGEVTARAFYRPPGEIIDIEITIERGRVRVWTTGEFRRPVALAPREALALTLGLRLLADEAETGRRDELRALARRLDERLAAVPAASVDAGFALEAGDPEGEGMLAVLRDAVRERERCRLVYLKGGAAAPEERTVNPYALVYAEGRWYALGRSERAGDVRAFRLDRILEVEPGGSRFEAPEAFDPGEYLEGGAVYRAEEEMEAVVRYSPRVARWIEERGIGEEGPGGGVVVRHRVADPRWLVRHVLGYGTEAEVLEPEELRELVADRLEQFPSDLL